MLSVSVKSFAVTDPVLTHRNDFNWGVCIHTPEINGTTYHPNNIDWQLKMAADMGVKMIRTGVSSRLYHTDRVIKMANDYGLKVMIVIPIPNRTFDINTPVDLENVKNTYKTYATRYNGKNGFGKVDYIQIDNEMDNTLMGRFGVETDGSSINNYHLSDLKVITSQVKAALEGIKSADSDVKSVINFAWKHYGMLDYFYQNGVEWDIIGHDWYSDMMYAEESNGKTAYEIGDILYEKFGKDIILCETNVFGNSFDFNDDDVSNWDVLIRAMQEYYKRDYVKGAVFYELCDQLGWQGEDRYEKEAHFGLLYTDKGGNLIKPKPIYYRLQSIIGGTQVEKSAICRPDFKSENTAIIRKDGILSGMNVGANKNSYYDDKGLYMFSAVDTRDAEYIEMDVYISHDTNSYPNIILSNNGDNPKSKSGFKFPLLKQGWNHIVLDYNNVYDGYTLDKSKVDTFFFGGVFSTENEVSVTVANLAFTKKTPELISRGNLYSKFYGYNNLHLPKGTDISAVSPIALPTPANLNVTGFIHFNLYVSEDCEVLLHFNSTPSRIAKPDVIASAYKTQSLKKGWNNIGIRTTDLVNLNGWDSNQRFNAQSITYIYFSGILSYDADIILSMGELVFTSSGLDADIKTGDYNADESTDMLDLVFVKNEVKDASLSWFPNLAEPETAFDSVINSKDLVALKKLLFARF